jgi:hypothetical protein
MTVNDSCVKMLLDFVWATVGWQNHFDYGKEGSVIFSFNLDVLRLSIGQNWTPEIFWITLATKLKTPAST